jgi:hypothetical protein
LHSAHARHPFPLKTIWTAAITNAILSLVISAATIPAVQAQVVSPNAQTSLELTAGETLLVSTDRAAIQRVTLLGNLTGASYSQDTSYPSDVFRLSTDEASKYELTILFDNQAPYTIAVSSLRVRNESEEIVSYYVSSGEFTLDLTVTFQPRPKQLAGNQSLIDAFLAWLEQFAEKFPLWVKGLYVILGAQFLVVGAAWIRYEDRKRRSDHVLSRFDRGNVAYLWSDVAYKFLGATFAILAVLMVGQFLILQVLRFMFLVELELLSLWDLFVLSFAGGMALLAFVLRTILGRMLDLRPLEDE